MQINVTGICSNFYQSEKGQYVTLLDSEQKGVVQLVAKAANGFQFKVPLEISTKYNIVATVIPSVFGSGAESRLSLNIIAATVKAV